MNIGLSYMTQIRGDENTGQLVGDAAEKNDDGSEKAEPSKRSLGGWIALTFNQLVASIQSGYHKEHNPDDTHGAIHCTSVSERGRTVPMGEWVQIPIGTTSFAGSGAMTVSVPTNYRTYAYTMVGKTMTVAWLLDSITVGGTPDTYIKLRIPEGKIAARFYANAAAYVSDNGAVIGGVNVVQAPSVASEPYIFIFKNNSANWTASAGLTSVWGQLSFEVL